MAICSTQLRGGRPRWPWLILSRKKNSSCVIFLSGNVLIAKIEISSCSNLKSRSLALVKTAQRIICIVTNALPNEDYFLTCGFKGLKQIKRPYQ